jgi:hypothetical protein
MPDKSVFQSIMTASTPHIQDTHDKHVVGSHREGSSNATATTFQGSYLLGTYRIEDGGALSASTACPATMAFSSKSDAPNRTKSHDGSDKAVMISFASTSSYTGLVSSAVSEV